MIDFVFGLAAGFIVGCLAMYLVNEWIDRAIDGEKKEEEEKLWMRYKE